MSSEIHDPSNNNSFEYIIQNEQGEESDSVAKLVIDFSHPWLKSTCKRDKHASGGPGRPVSVDS